MITTRQIDGLWTEGRTRQLVAELAKYRGELPFAVRAAVGASPVAAAAMAVQRLQELDQTLTATYRTLLQSLRNAQQADGSFGSVLVTTLAARALLDEPSAADSLRRALDYLASAQKSDGSFVHDLPLRMPSDALATSLVVATLARDDRARRVLRLEAAARWLIDHRDALEGDPRRLTDIALTRAGPTLAGQAAKLLALAA